MDEDLLEWAIEAPPPWKTSEPADEPDDTPWEIPGDALVTVTLEGQEHRVVEMKPDGRDALVKLEDGRCLRLTNVGPPMLRLADGIGRNTTMTLTLAPCGPWPPAIE